MVQVTCYALTIKRPSSTFSLWAFPQLITSTLRMYCNKRRSESSALAETSTYVHMNTASQRQSEQTAFALVSLFRCLRSLMLQLCPRYLCFVFISPIESVCACLRE